MILTPSQEYMKMMFSFNMFHFEVSYVLNRQHCTIDMNVVGIE